MTTKEFIKNVLCIDDLTIFGRHEEEYQLDILMDEYAKQYHESELKKLREAEVSGQVCEHRPIMRINSEVGWLCLECRKFSNDKQTFR